METERHHIEHQSKKKEEIPFTVERKEQPTYDTIPKHDEKESETISKIEKEIKYAEELEDKKNVDKWDFTTASFSHTMESMKLDTILIFLVNGLVGLAEALLGLRFFLKLLGASDTAPFVLWVYETSGSLLEPFSGMFPSPSLGRFFVLEFTTIFAMIVYAVSAFFVNKLIEFVYRQIMIALQKPSSGKHSEQPRTDLS